MKPTEVTRDELVAIIDHAYTTKDWTGPRSTAEVIADAVLAAGYWMPWERHRSDVDPYLQTADFGDDDAPSREPLHDHRDGAICHTCATYNRD